ncbi:phosphotransferase family protein, partial [Alteromonas sp. 14N.309.X.WAT.G.H12]|uniref:phosphotransferase family protein n=1 Tax=Alteromonas sp. 14N.309.X.WAT.G.H12 TaxID=3120824 RepID=UPI002FD69CC8
ARAGLPAQHPLVKQARQLIVEHCLDDKENGQWVLCHNDLSYGHMVDPLRPVIVDWEYAARGNRYFDMVACAQINRLDEHQSHQLCCLYGQRLQLAQAEVIAGFYEQQDVVTLTEQLWYAAFEAQQKG